MPPPTPTPGPARATPSAAARVARPPAAPPPARRRPRRRRVRRRGRVLQRRPGDRAHRRRRAALQRPRRVRLRPGVDLRPRRRRARLRAPPGPIDRKRPRHPDPRHRAARPRRQRRSGATGGRRPAAGSSRSGSWPSAPGCSCAATTTTTTPSARRLPSRRRHPTAPEPEPRRDADLLTPPRDPVDGARRRATDRRASRGPTPPVDRRRRGRPPATPWDLDVPPAVRPSAAPAVRARRRLVGPIVFGALLVVGGRGLARSGVAVRPASPSASASSASASCWAPSWAGAGLLILPALLMGARPRRDRGGRHPAVRPRRAAALGPAAASADVDRRPTS